MTAKPKPMKPVKAWGIVEGDRLLTVTLTARAPTMLYDSERIARVIIRELPKRKPAKGK